MVSYNKSVIPLNTQFISFGVAVASLGSFLLLQMVVPEIDRDVQPSRALLFLLLRIGLCILAILLFGYIVAGQQLLQGTLVAFVHVTPDRLAAITSLKAAEFINQIIGLPQGFTTF